MLPSSAARYGGSPTFIMQTVLRTLERAYSKIKVKQLGVSLTDDEIADGISEMNSMMWLMDADGLSVGWADVSASSATLPVPDYVIPFVENGVAIRLGTEFGVDIDPRLIGMFEEALHVLEKNLVRMPEIQYPNILPRGGGATSIYARTKFFGDERRGALQGGTAGYIRTEEDQIINSPTGDQGDIL